MAGSRIRGITVEIGGDTTKLEKALKGVNSEIRNTQSKLKDVEKLLKAFDVLISKGHTVVVVEHNLDVIRAADWVIDLGPDAGDKGGEVVFAGTPEDMEAEGTSYTAGFLRKTSGS